MGAPGFLRRNDQHVERAKLAAQRASAPELELKNDAAGQPTKATVKVSKSRVAKAAVKQPVLPEYQQPNVLPTGEAVPVGWQRNPSATSAQSDAIFKVSDSNGMQVGTADLKVVSPAMGPDDDSNLRNKSVGGVSTVALRRTVIDKMFKEQGWVVNDYQKDVDGKKVYVVVAQSPGAGGVQSRVFYFMEVDGRVYNLATSAPVNNSEKLAQDSEKVLNSLKRLSRPVQASAAATLR